MDSAKRSNHKVDRENSREKSRPKQGTCPVCGVLATLKCGGCEGVFYCDRSHQKEDWPRHKALCCAWEVRQNKVLGRHLVASRDLEAGETVLSESSLAWGPAIHAVQRVCVGCGKAVKSGCEKCGWPACASDCAGLIEKNSHGLECTILSKIKLVPRCDILLILRLLLLWRTKSKRWAALSELQSHEESRGPGTAAHEEVVNAQRYLQPVLSAMPGGNELVPKICGLIDVNAFETTPPEGSLAIYQTACLLEHSCVFNTTHWFSLDKKGRPRITVKAVTSIKKGQHLSTMYTHALWTTRARREHLLATKYFACRCERCADPTELGTHLGSLRCSCGNGLLLPSDPLDNETEWKCEICRGSLSANEVAGLVDFLENEVEEKLKHSAKNVKVLSSLFSKLTHVLHPGHQLCISVGHCLLQLLPAEDMQKRELCKRVINTVTILDPSYARLALYTAVALRELAQCPGEDRKKLLSQALSSLKLEPEGSPGKAFENLVKMELLALD